jgi:hypothetical protein
MQGFSVANMPASMVVRRSEILAQIAKNCHHGRELIREVPSMPPRAKSTSLIMRLAPRKITPEVTRRIDQLTTTNREMPSEAIARIVSETPGMPKIAFLTE